MIIVTSLALGRALSGTGAAAFLAQHVVALAGVLPDAALLSGVILIVAVLSNWVSSSAVGVIAAPIAIEVAYALGAPPEPFVLAVIFGANMSYATPFGYHTNLLLLSSGGYRYGDFLRIGVPLAVLMWLGFSIVLPILYPLA